MTKHKRICQVCGYSRPLKTRPARTISLFSCPTCGHLNSLKYVSWNGRSQKECWPLTAYQLEALRCAASGKTVKETCLILNRGSVAAVQDALNKAREKLGAENTTNAVYLAQQRGLFEWE